METKELIIEIPDGYEVDKDNSTFEKIVFKVKTPKYPTSVEEIKRNIGWYIDPTGTPQIFNGRANAVLLGNNYVSSQPRVKAFLALMQLVELRDAYNKIDNEGMKFEGALNFTIEVNKNNIIYNSWSGTATNRVLFFKRRETRDLFSKNFKDLIEEAKELL